VSPYDASEWDLAKR